MRFVTFSLNILNIQKDFNVFKEISVLRYKTLLVSTISISVVNLEIKEINKN